MNRKDGDAGIAAFWAILMRLKAEPRRGWLRKLGVKAPESVADHSYAVSMLCLFEAEKRGGYDLERVLKLALIHDLDEAITGDLTPADKQRMGRVTVRRERVRARETILEKLPPRARKEWRAMWTDLERKRSPEARLVKDLDLVEMALQAQAYGKKSGVGRQKILEFYRSALKGTRDAELRGKVEKIMKDRGKTS